MDFTFFDSALAKGLKLDSSNVFKPSQLPRHVVELILQDDLCRPSSCFNNSWKIVHSGILPGCEYVLALASVVLPIEHALIFHNGNYYDPTWQIHLGELGKEYLLIEKFTKEELQLVAKICKMEEGYLYPPMIDMLKANGNFRYLFIEQE